MTLEDRVETIATAYETLESARWRTYEAAAEFVSEATDKRDRGRRVAMLAERIGRSKGAVNLWVRAVDVVPEELRFAKVPVATCLWAAQNLSHDEAREWLERADNEGWSLSRLKKELGLADTSTLTTPTLRKIIRAVAAGLPKTADVPLDEADAVLAEAAVGKAIEKYVQGGGEGG